MAHPERDGGLRRWRVQVMDDDRVVITAPGHTELGDFLLRDIVVVGEWVTEDWGFDYYLVFVHRSGTWYAVPTGSIGEKSLLEFLGRRQVVVPFKLHATVGFTSRIFWPTELVGRPIFETAPLPRARWMRILLWFLPDRRQFRFAQHVLTYLDDDLEDNGQQQGIP